VVEQALIAELCLEGSDEVNEERASGCQQGGTEITLCGYIFRDETPLTFRTLIYIVPKEQQWHRS
jgi:hypothetical protein